MTHPLSVVILSLFFLCAGSVAGYAQATGDDPDPLSPPNGPIACDITANVSSTSPVLCNGDATGSAVITAPAATPPLLFFPDGQTPALTDGNLSQIFAAGNHFVIVQDSNGCRDTVYFTITEPLPLSLSVSATDAICNGDPDGTATAAATGGTGTITYAWQGCQGGPVVNNATATNLYAGCYAVTVTDGNGCSATATVTVGEPTPFIFTSSQTPVRCKGGADGSASMEVTGGTPPYEYDWDNGDTSGTADSLKAGFHFVTITDFAGCQAATFVIVLEPTLLVVDSITSIQTSCFNGGNGSAKVYPKGGTMPYTYLWSDSQSQITQQANNLSAGSYTVTVTDAKGCTVQASVPVTSPTQLLASVTAVVHEKCDGACDGSVTVAGSGGTGPYTYQWDDPSIPDGPPTAPNLCGGTYMVTVVDFRGCTATEKATVNPALAIDIHIDAIAPACAGFQDGSVFATVVGGNPPYQIGWNNGASGPSVIGLPCGLYTMTLTDNAGCTKTETVTLDCPAPVEILSVSSQQVKCFGEANASITIEAGGGTGTLSYKWNDPGMQTGPTASGLPAGSYTVTVTDGNGCTASSTIQISQPDLLEINITKTDVTCFQGADGTATTQVTGGTDPYTYAWNPANSGPNLNNLSAGNYLVTVEDAQGCTATAVTDIVQPASAVELVVSQTRTACFGQSSGQATAVALGGNGPVFTYTWSNGQTGAVADNLPSGTASVTAADSKGCTVVQSLEIQQWAAIEVGVAWVEPTCFGYADGKAAINLLTGGAGMGDTTKYTYQWSIPNSPNSIYVDGLAGGINYSVTVTDLEGCSGTATFVITQPPPIGIQHTAKDITCFGQADGSIEVTGVSNATLPVTYTWDTGASGPVIDNLPAGDYIVDVTDAEGCFQSDTISVGEPEALAVTFEVKQLVCSYDSNAVITATVSGGTPEYDLQWDNGSTGNALSDLGPGTYILNITDQNGCTLVDTVDITRPDSLIVQSQAYDPKCYGNKDGRINLIITGGQPPLGYSINGGPYEGSSAFIGLGAGIYSFRIRNGNGCIVDYVDTLQSPAKVGVALDPDTTITLGDSLILSAGALDAVGMTEFEWNSVLLETLTCVDSPECTMMLIKPYQTNSYIVKVTDENGCKGQNLVKVTVNKPRGVYVPTGFSPNGDLNNDRLVVYGKGRQIRNVVAFNVFDRWGELVYQDQNFQVNDDARGWDGSFRGKDCDPGVYVWYVEVEYLDGFREAWKGEVTLLR